PARRGECGGGRARAGGRSLWSGRAAQVAEGLAPAELVVTADSAELGVHQPQGPDFRYRLRARSRPLPAYTVLDAPEGRRAVEWRLVAETEGRGPRDVTGLGRDQIVADVLERLAAWRAG